MNDDIPFDKNLELAPGHVVDEPMPGVRRIMANNPGPFTFKGTVSYIIGRGKVAILDPGPDDPAHIGALLDAVRDETVTPHFRHPHPPRSFAGGAGHQGGDRRHGLCRRAAPCRAAIAYRRAQSARCQRRSGLSARCGAEGWRGRQRRRLVDRSSHDAGPYRQSHGLCAQGEKCAVCRRPRHGLGDLDCRAAGRRHERLHGVAWQSSRAARRPPISPATGPRSATRRASSTDYILHRKAREARSCIVSPKGETDIPTIVRAIYIGIDPRLTGAAGLSVLAHMEDLVTRGLVQTDGLPAIDGVYRLAG